MQVGLLAFLPFLLARGRRNAAACDALSHESLNFVPSGLIAA